MNHIPFHRKPVAIATAVVLLHVGGLAALQSGLLVRAYEMVVPVEMLSQIIEPPKPEIAPPPLQRRPCLPRPRQRPPNKSRCRQRRSHWRSLIPRPHPMPRLSHLHPQHLCRPSMRRWPQHLPHLRPLQRQPHLLHPKWNYREAMQII